MEKESLLKALSKVKPEAFKGLVFRNVREGYDPLNDTGSLKRGGRYNRRGKYGALYAAFGRKTCIEELKREAKRRGIDIEDLQPRDIVKIKVKIKKVLDLTDPETLSILGINKDELIKDDNTLPRVP